MRRLYRGGGYIGGVCEGLGSFFDIDPIFPRLFFIITLGAGSFWVYLILWIFSSRKEKDDYI